MKKNGFTMIEVISVIALLGIILLVALPKFFTSRNENNLKEKEKRIDLIINAGRLYLVNNEKNVGEDVNISVLCSEDYLECPVMNPVTKTKFNGRVYSEINSDGERTFLYSDN